MRPIGLQRMKVRSRRQDLRRRSRLRSALTISLLLHGTIVVFLLLTIQHEERSELLPPPSPVTMVFESGRRTGPTLPDPSLQTTPTTPAPPATELPTPPVPEPPVPQPPTPELVRPAPPVPETPPPSPPEAPTSPPVAPAPAVEAPLPVPPPPPPPAAEALP